MGRFLAILAGGCLALFLADTVIRGAEPTGQERLADAPYCDPGQQP